MATRAYLGQLDITSGRREMKCCASCLCIIYETSCGMNCPRLRMKKPLDRCRFYLALLFPSGAGKLARCNLLRPRACRMENRRDSTRCRECIVVHEVSCIPLEHLFEMARTVRTVRRLPLLRAISVDARSAGALIGATDRDLDFRRLLVISRVSPPINLLDEILPRIDKVRAFAAMQTRAEEKTPFDRVEQRARARAFFTTPATSGVYLWRQQAGVYETAVITRSYRTMQQQRRNLGSPTNSCAAARLGS